MATPLCCAGAAAAEFFLRFGGSRTGEESWLMRSGDAGRRTADGDGQQLPLPPFSNLLGAVGGVDGGVRA